MQQAELQLHDIHVAPPPPWWPPAWGWWLLAALVLAGAVWLVLWSRRQLARRRYRKQLMSEVDQVLNQWHTNRDDRQALSSLSILLRRLVIHAGNNPHLAGVAGAPWVEQLEVAVGQQPDLKAAAQVLATAQYQSNPPTPDIPALSRLARCWVQQVTRV